MSAAYRSTVRAVLVVSVLLAPIGLVPEPRVNGKLEFPHPWIWAGIIAAFALTPYITVWVLSSPAQSAVRQQAARGIAAGTAAAAIIALGFALLVALYVLLFGRTVLLTVQIAGCVVLLALNARLWWLAIRKPAPFDRAFFGGALSAFAFAGLATRAVQHIDVWAADHVMAPERNAYALRAAAGEAVRQLAVCGTAYRMSHGSLPTDLPALVSAPECDPSLASRSAVPQYILAVSVDPADTVNPDATMGCKFTATPATTPHPRYGAGLDLPTFWSTCAGRSYLRESGQSEAATMGSSQLLEEINLIFRGVVLTARASGGRYPPTLTALLASPYLQEPKYKYDAYVLSRTPRAVLDSNVIRQGYYVARYVPGTNDFRIEIGCQPYGPMCMRGYVIDSSGAVRATGEPRPARASDPRAERCELLGGLCDGQPASIPKPQD